MRRLIVMVGTMILENIWSVFVYANSIHNDSRRWFREMSQDTRYFSDPDEFRPERFLDEKDNIGKSTKSDVLFIFGFGRR